MCQETSSWCRHTGRLILVSISDLDCDMIRNDESVGVAGKEIQPVDTEEVHQDRRIHHND